MRDWPQSPTVANRRAVFLDRDGTLTVDTHYPHRVEELDLLPRSLEATRLLAAIPVDIIVVSNQAGIALGLFSVEQMSAYNRELRKRVEQAGGRIDAFYYCPHKEPKNLGSDEQPCACAKPAPGMLLEAAADFGIDLRQSFMVGDKLSDIAAGKAVGALTFLVQTGKAGKEEDEKIIMWPDRVVADLLEAAMNIGDILAQRCFSEPHAVSR